MRRLLVATLIALVEPAAAQEPAPAGEIQWTRVSYLSGGTVYLEAGSRAGLTLGHLAEVVRAGTVLARLRVSALASTRAACTIESGTAEVVVGDSVRFVTARRAATPAPAGAQQRAVRREQRSTSPTLHGRMGVRYLMLDAGGVGLRQPAIDVRLDGWPASGVPARLALDLRAQRTAYVGADRGDLNRTRVYQANLQVDLRRAVHLTAGRQYATVSNIGIFDGIGAELAGNRLAVGAFGGSQPDGASMGVSGTITEYGAYLRAQGTPASASVATSLTVGGVGSYDHGHVDREYAFANLVARHRALNVYVTQELDVNRAWKRASEGSATTPTATYVSVQAWPVRAVSVYAGVDSRRAVRLYRDYLNPEQAFDDTFRRGVWGGLAWSASPYVRISADRRQSSGGTAGTAGVTSVTAAATNLTRWHLGGRTRWVDYSGTRSAGQLVSVAVESAPWDPLRIEFSGGTRAARSTAAGDVPARMSWVGVDADISIRRSLYLLLSTSREREGGTSSTQTYASLSWRF